MSAPTRTVLVVDDDPQMLRLIRAMLAPHDVNVVAAKLPSDALKFCNEATVDLLISDISMPEMDGNKLAERVLKLHPQASVLLISGAVDAPPAVRKAQVRFLRKPFFPAELIRVLRDMLRDRTESA